MTNDRVSQYEKSTKSLLSDDTLFRGKIDLLTKDGVVVDYKTSSKTSQSVEELEMSYQLDLYALSEIASAESINAIEYRIIEKPTIKLKKNEAFEDYLERCIEWVYEKVDEKIATIVRPVTEDRMEAARLWIESGSADIKRCRRLNYWPQSINACHNYNIKCPFLSLCAAEMSGENTNYIMRTKYEHYEPEHGRDLEADIVGYSVVSNFRLCQRRYYYQHELLLQPKGHKESEALTFGKAFHRSIELAGVEGLEISLYECRKLLDHTDHYLSEQDIAKIMALTTICYDKWIINEEKDAKNG